MECMRCGLTPCECAPSVAEKRPEDFVFMKVHGKLTRFDRCNWTYRTNRCLHAATSHMGNGPRCQYHEFLGRHLDGNAELVAEQTLFDDWWAIRYQKDDDGKSFFWHKAHGAARLEVIK